jgi:alpha-glucosidase
MKTLLFENATLLAAHSGGFTASCLAGTIRVTFLANWGVRVEVALPMEPFEHNPYSIVDEAFNTIKEHTQWVLETIGEDNASILCYTTDLYRVEFNLLTCKLNIYTSSGQEILVDDAGLGVLIDGTSITTHKKLFPDERFIGLGEKTGPLDRRGKGYQHWNTDFFGYGEVDDPLYCSTPFYMGLHGQLCYGLYLNNSYKSHFNFGASNERFSSITVEGGTLDYFIFLGQTPAQLTEHYTYLTGRPPLPPRWALGLQQCRYSYYPEHEVHTIADTFRTKQIPADVIYLDIHYMDAYKVFTWDKERFPDPLAMHQRLAEQGFKVVVIFDPGIKVEADYSAYEEAKEGDHFVRYADGSLYQGQVWPGWCHFPDFTKEDTRAWWGTKMKEVTQSGVEGFWTDMNEPATWGQRFPDATQFNMDGEPASNRRAHNLYGFQMARATYEGSLAAREGKRPFVLTRAGYSGIQRYAAVWTGDNTASDGHMLLGVRLLNAMGLTGLSFCGMDIGGFVGDTDRCLFARWITIGAFSPLCRIHTMVDSRDNEPWSYGEKIEAISRNYINLRYRLLPHFYSLFRRAEQTGLPVQASLALTEPYAWQTFDHRYHHQFLLGTNADNGILIAPCSAYTEFVQVYLPQTKEGQAWYYLYQDTRYTPGEHVLAAPLELLPAFVAPGTILPMQSVTQHTGQACDGVLSLHIYKGLGESRYNLYWDEGDGFTYKDGNYYSRHIHYIGNEDRLILEQQQGNLPSPWHTLRIILHGYTAEVHFVVNDTPLHLMATPYRFVEPLPAFDPFGNDQTSYSCSVLMADLPL